MNAQWKEFCNSLNRKGLPLPMLRDPETGKGSVSLTLLWISFNFWLFSIVGKIAGILGGIDTNSTFQMVSLMSALYWGRKLTSDGKSVTVEETPKKD